MYNKFLKKIFDIFLAIILLITLLPLYIFVSLYLFFTIGSPVIFKDNRAGKNGEPFVLFKFRTMSKKNSTDYSIEDDRKRVLKKTLFLRISRLDEMPQLFNVLKGNISFVGPRPLLIEYNNLYSEKHKTRLSIKPGITGWSQINLDKIDSWKKKFDYDYWYVQNMSFFLDLKIISYTFIFLFKNLFNKKNINSVFSEKFNGDN